MKRKNKKINFVLGIKLIKASAFQLLDCNPKVSGYLVCPGDQPQKFTKFRNYY